MTANALHKAIVATMPWLPRPLIWQFSRRYIAGTQLDDAFARVTQLNASGCSATIDVLGEDSTTESEVRSAVELYRRALAEIVRKHLDCGISVKLSELGLRFDEQGCRQALDEVADAARASGNFVRIDMEDSSVTDVTLDIYRDLRRRYENVGAVIQACLRRSADDVAALLHEGATDLRLCKGIYVEPEVIAYRDADEIRNSFTALLEQILDDARSRVGIATHDRQLADIAEELIERKGIPQDRYEFQMLLGVAGTLRRELVGRGHPLRVYVPFGELWYAYSIRRLRENPNIAGHIVSNLFSRQ